MPTHCIVDAEKDANMKSLSQKEAIAILSDMKIDIPVPKAAVTQRKRNVALDMAISALSCSEMPNSSDSISRQMAIDVLDKRFDSIPMEQTTEILQLRKDLRELPSAQSERKRGKWIAVTEDGDVYKRICSCCGQEAFFQNDDPDELYDGGRYELSDFCPHCGAEMSKK